jgi:hypothetical protein
MKQLTAGNYIILNAIETQNEMTSQMQGNHNRQLSELTTD